MRENTPYMEKIHIQNETEKANSARARAQWPVGTGVWATAGLGRALSAVSHTHTRETRSSAPAAAGSPRPPSREPRPASPERSSRPQAAPCTPRVCDPSCGAARVCARPRDAHTLTVPRAWSMEGRGEAGTSDQAGGPDADDGTYERTEIDRSEREATPDATRTGASGHSSCAHRPPRTGTAER